jgi:hypothetical protein
VRPDQSPVNRIIRVAARFQVLPLCDCFHVPGYRGGSEVVHHKNREGGMA